MSKEPHYTQLMKGASLQKQGEYLSKFFVKVEERLQLAHSLLSLSSSVFYG